MTTTTARRVWTPLRATALALSTLAVIAGLALSTDRAMAAFVNVIENGLPGHLSLAADPYPTTLNPQFMAMSPGSTVHWQIAASLVDPSSPLTMQFKRDGELVERPSNDGLHVAVALCDVEWTGLPAAPGCATGALLVVPSTPANSAVFGPLAGNSDPVPGAAPVYSLGTITNAADKFVLVTLSIPPQADPDAQSDQSLMGLQASFGFGFTAMGDDPDLPGTGLNLGGLILAGLGVLGLGLTLAAAHRIRVRPDDGRA